MHEWRPVGHRPLHVEHDRQRLVVDLDGFERVDRLGVAAGDHDGDGVADVADLVAGDREVRRRLQVRG